MPRKKKTTNKPEVVETKEAPKPVKGSVAWTVDIRESFQDGLTKKDLDELFAEYREKDLEITQLYCRDYQVDQIKEFGGYEDVTLTVE